MKAIYSNVTVTFSSEEYSLLKLFFSYLSPLFYSNRSAVSDLIDSLDSSDANLVAVLRALVDLYDFDYRRNHDVVSIIRQFRDM